jgi:hypothetical protein
MKEITDRRFVLYSLEGIIKRVAKPQATTDLTVQELNAVREAINIIEKTL